MKKGKILRDYKKGKLDLGTLADMLGLEIEKAEGEVDDDKSNDE